MPPTTVPAGSSATSCSTYELGPSGPIRPVEQALIDALNTLGFPAVRREAPPGPESREDQLGRELGKGSLWERVQPENWSMDSAVLVSSADFRAGTL
jgi:hypothetical protein